MCRIVHAHITNLSLHWNWPRGDALNTGRFLTPPHHSWRLTWWFIATNKGQRQSTLLEAQDWLMPSLKAGEIWTALTDFPVLFLPRWTTLLSLWSFSPVIRDFSPNLNYCSTAFLTWNATFSSTESLKNIFNIHLSYHSIVIHRFDYYYYCVLSGLSASQFIPNSQSRQNSPAKNPPTLLPLWLHHLPSWVPLLASFYLLQHVNTSCLPLQCLAVSQPITTSSLLSYIRLTEK